MPAELSAVSSHAIALDAPPEEPQEGAVDAALGWFSLYLPSWGSSFVLHVGAVILALFFAVTQQSVDVPPPVFVGWAPIPAPPKIEKARKVTTRPFESVGKLKPQPSQFSFIKNDLKTPGIGELHRLADYEIVFGVGGSPRGGGLEGLGIRNTGTPTIFIEDEQNHKIVYVVDRSGSMTDSLVYVKFELKRSIQELSEEKEFHIIFYSSGPPVEMPTRRLVRATERNKQQAFEFIDTVIAQGETDPSGALERAFGVKPDLIYLLTDGEFDRSIVDLVRGRNPGGKVTVHTIGFLYQIGETVLKQIADENNGNYKFVSEKDLANLVE